MKKLSAACFTGILIVAAAGAQATSFVQIDSTNNAADTSGYGAVAYTYRISQYEVTGAEFQTAVDDDARVGFSVPNSGSYPAAMVSWYDAAKYCNWLTTGDAYLGAYQFDENGTLTNVMSRAQILADGGLFYLLPTEDEWHKAAYFDSESDTYSLYANGTGTAPATSESRYGANSTWAAGTGLQEQNGTYDMMGNVYEWTESAADGTLDDMAENRVLRGGTYNSTADALQSLSRFGNAPEAEEPGGGFRIAALSGKQLPAADAGGPYIEPAISWVGGRVTLNGLDSVDPDGGELTYEWDLNLARDSDSDGNPSNDVDAAFATAVYLFPIGQTDIALVVRDASGLASEPDITSVQISIIEVAIDIKPGSYPNFINMKSHGVVPVAFLSDETFDATTIDPRTITLRGEDVGDGLIELRGRKNIKPMARFKDVDRDGDMDLLVMLDIQKLFDYEVNALCILGARTYDGYVVRGSDTIQIVPKRPLRRGFFRAVFSSHSLRMRK
jgi:hypothetical protein